MNYYSRAIVPESFYVFLASSGSHEYFPDNTTQCFATKLPDPIEQARQLEVGLVELRYTPIRDPAKKIFHKEEDKKITVIKQLSTVSKIKKRPVRIDDFVQFINRDLEQTGIAVSFAIKNTTSGLKFILKQDVEDKVCVIDPSYAAAFGFTKEEYNKGRHVAELNYSQAKFDSIDITHPFILSLNKDEETIVHVQEPEEPDVSHLISAINKSLTQFRILFIYANGTLEYENKHTPSTRILLSDFLGGIFDVPKGHWFSKNIELLPSYNNINLETESNYVHVRCNIVTPQPIRGRPAPILRTLANPMKFEETVKLEFNPVRYVQIPDDTKIDVVQIELLDEFMRPITCLDNTDTTAILHVKPRFF